MTCRDCLSALGAPPMIFVLLDQTTALINTPLFDAAIDALNSEVCAWLDSVPEDENE